MIRGLDHVQIAAPAGSESDMRAFYCSVLGLREVAKPSALRHRGGLWFGCGNMQLHIGIDEPPPVNVSSRRHVAFEVDDLERVRAVIMQAGRPIEVDTAPLAGQQRFYSRDPAGNRVEFVQRLS